jgi:hypothetical protein
MNVAMRMPIAESHSPGRVPPAQTRTASLSKCSALGTIDGDGGGGNGGQVRGQAKREQALIGKGVDAVAIGDIGAGERRAAMDERHVGAGNFGKGDRGFQSGIAAAHDHDAMSGILAGAGQAIDDFFQILSGNAETAGVYRPGPLPKRGGCGSAPCPRSP